MSSLSTLCALLLSCVALPATEAPDRTLELVLEEESVLSPPTVPEPHPLIVAGLGSIALLLVAVRRK